MTGILLHLVHGGRTFHGLDPALVFLAALAFAIAVMAIWSGDDATANPGGDDASGDAAG